MTACIFGRPARWLALTASSLSLAGCSLFAANTSTPYDLPAETLARATATVDAEPFCYHALAQQPYRTDTRPQAKQSCGATPVFAADGKSVLIAANGTPDSCAAYDLASGAMTGSRPATSCQAANASPASYAGYIDCFDPAEKLPGEPFLTLPSGWRSGLCTFILEDKTQGIPVATMPLGYDRLDDTRALSAHVSPDGQWLVVIDTHGKAHSFRVDEL